MTTDFGAAEAARRSAAREVFLAIAKDPGIVRGNRTIAEASSDDDLSAMLDLAWRHQFSSERYTFKKEIRELGSHVIKRVTLNDESGKAS